MKRLIVLCMMCLLLCPMLAAQTRMQISGTSFINLGTKQMEPIPTIRVGFSQKIFDVGLGSMYGAVLGKFGEAGEIKGGQTELLWFPVRPISGIRGFICFGPDVSITDFDGRDPATYLQLATGGGAYWDVSPKIAIWLGAKFGTVLDSKFTTLDVAAGISYGLFGAGE